MHVCHLVERQTLDYFSSIALYRLENISCITYHIGELNTTQYFVCDVIFVLMQAHNLKIKHNYLNDEALEQKAPNEVEQHGPASTGTKFYVSVHVHSH